jgi:hypothetical protein
MNVAVMGVVASIVGVTAHPVLSKVANFLLPKVQASES